MRLKITFFILALSISLNSNATRYYVNVFATGNGSGFSWDNAYTDLQVALSNAIFGDEIWVAAGTYKPSSTGDRNVAFEMRNGVNLYGNFGGTETNINQRDFTTNPTTLSGDIGQVGSNIDNSGSVMRILNLTTDFILDGFRIISAYDTNSSGGGIYADSNAASDITIRNCLFFNNYAYTAGGACRFDESNVTFENCKFISNSSSLSGGGAISAQNGSDTNLYFYNCEFIGNTGDTPVLNFDGPELIIDRCIINNNTASSRNVITVGSETENFQLRNSLIVGNLITSSNGTIISTYCTTNGAVEFVNVTIAQNQHESSAGPYYEMIRSYNRGIRIQNSIIYDNFKSNGRQIDNGNFVNNSILEGGYSTGNNVLDVDPLFANAPLLDDSPFDYSSYDYSLTSSSTAINAGDNTEILTGFEEDLYGSQRIQNGTVDLGAIETPSSLSLNDYSSSRSAYFNSVTNELFILDFERLLNKTLKVYSLDGKMVIDGVIKNRSMMFNLKPSIYLVELDSKEVIKIITN